MKLNKSTKRARKDRATIVARRLKGETVISEAWIYSGDWSGGKAIQREKFRKAMKIKKGADG